MNKLSYLCPFILSVVSNNRKKWQYVSVFREKFVVKTLETSYNIWFDNQLKKGGDKIGQSKIYTNP